MSHAVSLFDFVNQYFDRAAAGSGLPPGLLEVMKACNSVYRFTFPFRRNDGQLENVNAWHYSRLNPDLYAQALRELEGTAA